MLFGAKIVIILRVCKIIIGKMKERVVILHEIVAIWHGRGLRLLQDMVNELALLWKNCNFVGEMLKFVAIILSGMAVGFLMRKRRLRVVPHLVTALIWALLFFLGVEVGENPQVIHGITNLGVEALWLSLAGLAGTVLASWALWRWISSRKGDSR